MVARGTRSTPAHDTSRIALIALEIFTGLSAIGGGAGLLGGWLGMSTSMLDGSPFEDYTIPGLVLLIVVGGSQLLAALAMLRRRNLAAAGSAGAGLILIGWIAVQVAIISLNSWLQPVIFAIGMLEVVLAFMPDIQRHGRVSLQRRRDSEHGV